MCQCLLSDFFDIIATFNNINAQQETFKVDKSQKNSRFRPEKTFDRQSYFPKQN